MSTFSQIVDELLLETKRPDLATEIGAYVNQTVRELHFRPDTGSAMLFRENLTELSVTADVETGFTWDAPSPATFQAMYGVRYATRIDRQGNDVWAHEVVPNRALVDDDTYYYRMGSTFVFADYGGADAQIDLAYYSYPSRLKYKAAGARPATWDDEDGWSYYTVGLVNYDLNDETRETARSLTSNWLLLRWHDLVLEGAKAKIYKRVSDEVRGKLSYSLYNTLRQGFWTSEVAEFGGRP